MRKKQRLFSEDTITMGSPSRRSQYQLVKYFGKSSEYFLDMRGLYSGWLQFFFFFPLDTDHWHIRAQWLEYSMIAVNLISIGHLSTTALAAVSLGIMTANVTGVSVLTGLASGLDTVLPAAFTSPQPQFVGLWAQRMGSRGVSHGGVIPTLVVARFTWIVLRSDKDTLVRSPNKLFDKLHPSSVLTKHLLVWGPQPIRLGYIGAPIATVASYYLISITSFTYGRYLVPQTAWHPLSKKMFYDLGILTRLGLSGVGMFDACVSAIAPIELPSACSAGRVRMVGLGMCRAGYVLLGPNRSRLPVDLDINIKHHLSYLLFKRARCHNSHREFAW
ncbi:hypothetical protein C0995_008670 [Termitomyces sp. Mi166|nr:hypothetical protein C0995_008670 [Termitomyces sp. Mi166\